MNPRKGARKLSSKNKIKMTLMTRQNETYRLELAVVKWHHILNNLPLLRLIKDLNCLLQTLCT